MVIEEVYDRALWLAPALWPDKIPTVFLMLLTMLSELI